jgi:GNAT superfamily N-acetyltransferase
MARSILRGPVDDRGPRLIDAGVENFDALPCCGIKCATHAGRQEKRRWLESNAHLGLRAKALLAPDGQPSGYIEYIPGESAWRGVNAANYLFIHCVWIYSKQYQRKGWGRVLVNACIEDAKHDGKSGVAAVAREGPWMADRRLFLGCGFEAVDTAPPDYTLFAYKFDRSAANPSFMTDWDRKPGRYGKGLTIIRSSQCPHIAKFATDIVETAAREFHVKPKVVDLSSPLEAQNAPTPYAVFYADLRREGHCGPSDQPHPLSQYHAKAPAIGAPGEPLQCRKMRKDRCKRGPFAGARTEYALHD